MKEGPIMRNGALFNLLVSDINNIGLHDEDITDIRTKELEHLLDTAVEAVKKKLPDEKLRDALDAIIDITQSLRYSQQDIGICIGVLMAGSLKAILKDPFGALREATNTYNTVLDAENLNVRTINRVITSEAENENNKRTA